MMSMPSVESEGAHEVFFEFTSVGSAVKVAAIDSETGVEIAVMGPATASQADLQRLALGKLKVRLARGQ